MARTNPGKLTDERQAIIFGLIRQGCPQATAAQKAGIGARTFYDWCARGKAARSGKYKQFWLELQKAIAVSEASLVLDIRKHGKRDWRANAWLLARRFPDRWKEHKAIEQTITPQPGAPPPVVVQLSAMTAEQLSALSGVDLDGMGLPTDDPTAMASDDEETGE